MPCATGVTIVPGVGKRGARICGVLSKWRQVVKDGVSPTRCGPGGVGVCSHLHSFSRASAQLCYHRLIMWRRTVYCASGHVLAPRHKGEVEDRVACDGSANGVE